MANKRELELERQALLLEIAGKIDFIYNLLSQASIQQIPDSPVEEKKSERKTRKKTKKTE
jgi:hypothetical protein